MQRISSKLKRHSAAVYRLLTNAAPIENGRGLMVHLSAAVVCALMWVAPASAGPVTKYRLDNGLQVFIVPNHRSPVAIQMLMYKTGSVNEQRGRTGLAHVLEHMMFKGTPRFPGNAFSRFVSRVGGQENAFTTRENTGYFQQVPNTALARVITMEADRMSNLTQTEAEFTKELAVVMEERRSRVDDRPRGRMREQLLASAYLVCPCRNPVVGWMSDLEHLSVEDARHWYKRWYTPNNAVLFIAGDVDPQEVIALVKKTYGQIKSRELPSRARFDEPPQQGERRTTVIADVKSPVITMAFHVPALRQVETDSDPYALAMLAAVLSSGDTGRLTKNLVRDSRVANSASASYSMVSNGPALFSLHGVPARGHDLAEMESALLAQVALIATQGVGELELKHLKTQFVASQVFERDSLFSQIQEISGLELSGLGYDNYDRILDKVKAVTPQQVQDVASKYFKSTSMTVANLLPKPSSVAVATNAKRAFEHADSPKASQ